MEVPVAGKDSNTNINGLSPRQSPVYKNRKRKSHDGKESANGELTGFHHMDTEMQTFQTEHGKNASPKSGEEDTKQGMVNTPSKSPSKKKASVKPAGRRYSLRSSLDGVRVLRSMSKAKDKTPVESVNIPANPVRERRQRRKRVKRASKDEYSVIRKRLRYLLTRMNYEQNLLDAYSGEGWRGQSLEKIKPEKELERAKSEILRRKLNIRDLFHHLDSLLSEGKLQEALFDSEGEICSEDIFCAKCRLRDVSVGNDIILCDGICDRGFHQKCLNPPLLTENIPPGDEGWLCPGCDCKVDCIDLVNESQGSRLKLKDTWEKVFPEASASANGDEQYDDSGLPSDDSEDDNYEPDVPEIDSEDQEEGSDTEESNFTSSPEDLQNLKHNKCDADFGFPSDDSEDDDYDPDDLNPDEKDQNDGSSSDKSDFSSDSDDFCTELCKSSVANHASVPVSSDLKPFGGDRSVGDGNGLVTNSMIYSEQEQDLNQDVVMSGKRRRQLFDYKKLYDETYGHASTDSSGDEDWLNTSKARKGKKDVNRKKSTILPKENMQTIENQRTPKRAQGKPSEDDIRTKSALPQTWISHAENESTPQRSPETSDSGDLNSFAKEQNNSREFNYDVKMATTSSRSRKRMTSEKLLESFKENQYPSRETKETLAEELGLTVQQVSKWFGNARHSMKVSAKDSMQARITTPDKSTAINANHVERTPDKGPAAGVSGDAITIQPRIATPEGTTSSYSLWMTTSGVTTTRIINPDKGHAEEESCAAVMELTDGNKLTGTLRNTVQNSVGKRKMTEKDANIVVGMEVAEDRAKEDMNKARQKAIARELRKRRLSR